MKTFPIANASAVMGISLVAGGLHTATAAESEYGPETMCYYSYNEQSQKATCVVADPQGTVYSDCAPGMASGDIFVMVAQTICATRNTSGNGTP